MLLSGTASSMDRSFVSGGVANPEWHAHGVVQQGKLSFKVVSKVPLASPKGASKRVSPNDKAGRGLRSGRAARIAQALDFGAEKQGMILPLDHPAMS